VVEAGSAAAEDLSLCVLLANALFFGKMRFAFLAKK